MADEERQERIEDPTPDALAKLLGMGSVAGEESDPQPQTQSMANGSAPPAGLAAGRPTRPRAAPAIGATWGKYLIEKSLGAGGQAEVFQAYDRFGAAGHVALKVARGAVPADQVEAWTSAEAQPLVKLDHPSIVRVVDAGCVDGRPYVAMELVDGLPLDAYVQNHPPLLGQVLDWMTQLAGALAAAHDRGIIHRDIKPRNIIVSDDGRPRMIDFGIATLISPYRPDALSGTSGTPAFMPPEQARGEGGSDHRVDLFALGGVLKFLLDGTGPYGKPDRPLKAAREGKVQFAPTEDGPPMRRALARIANRALQCDPDARFRNAREMIQAFRGLRSRRRLLAAAAATVLAAGLAAAWILPRLRHGPSPARHRPVIAPKPEPKCSLVIHFQRADERDTFLPLSSTQLPLRSGDRIQIHARLPEPMAVYLVLLSSGGGGQMSVLYPPQGRKAVVTDRVDIPPGRDEWLELTDPGGTETLLLLARREPLEDVATLKEQLASLGPAPVLRGVGLLVASRQGIEFIDPAGMHRHVGTRPVKVRKGMLAELLESPAEKWAVVRAISFPHTAPASPPATVPTP